MSRSSGNQRYTATYLGDVLETQGRKQRWLAERIGVSGGYVSLIIGGERTVDRETGERIAALLDVPFFLLFSLGNQSNSFSHGERRG
jgi:transcriptional regulator with XRE-family HTH domain